MQNKVTDKNNYRLSNDAYNISGGIIKDGEMTSDQKFRVLAVENNKDNGMQAMAVAPLDSNVEVDTKQIEIFKLNNFNFFYFITIFQFIVL